MPRKRASVVARVLSWVVFHILSTAVGMRCVAGADVIIAPSPPLTIGLGAWLLARYHRVPYVYNVQEIYPDIAINLGAVRNGVLIRILRGIERFIYRTAAAITVIAPRMKEKLLARGVSARKLHVIPNFVDTATLFPRSRENQFSREYGLKNKFVVTYAGNIGPAQGLSNLLDAAALLKSDSGYHFMIIGHGVSTTMLQRRIVDEELPNVTLLPYQPFERMADIYASSDLCVVPQAAETGSDAIPSKVYRIMACERAVLAVTDEDSDLGRLVTDSSCGIVVRPGSSEEMVDALLRARSDSVELRNMAKRGLGHVQSNYTRPVITAQYATLVEQLIAS